MTYRRLSRRSAGVSLRCRGCHRTATASNMSADRLAEMIGWWRADDGDWCLLCQEERGRVPELLVRIVPR